MGAGFYEFNLYCFFCMIYVYVDA